MRDYLYELDKCSDQQLVTEYNNGNDSAFDVLHERYKQLINLKVSGITQSGFDISDLKQECSIALMKAVRAYDKDKGAAFKTFADTCIHNQIVSFLRKHNRNMDEPIENIENIASENFIESRRGFQVSELKLSTAEQKVFSLYSQSLSYNEIAAHLKITQRSVDNAMQRVRKKARSKNILSQ